MSRRYDSRTTTFSPDGRLYQVEYALEAINKAAPTIGILCKDGVILAADKAVVSKLLDPGKTLEKLYTIDNHIICAVAGLTADANILISQARIDAQRYQYTYGERQPVEQLVVQICDRKQSYTQFGGLRPFGVSFLFAGYDHYHGYQLYQSDPSGNYSGWMATAIGQNNQTATSMLKQEWKNDLSVDEGLLLIAKVLTKTMDTTSPSANKLEFSILKHDDKFGCSQKILSHDEIQAILNKVQVENLSENTNN
ncbi:proteasome subunit Alpha type 4 [Cryptosporidium andersoni]|uniref:Proteasome subunit alpha type n=1 Tax=Cryptosporidium andersoni TaxID=117008 RepID=A0A1J4MFH2_9CRYT|nr:proteasome subunit Alpha type 4 [Cryptosporidium andersoni]